MLFLRIEIKFYLSSSLLLWRIHHQSLFWFSIHWLPSFERTPFSLLLPDYEVLSALRGPLISFSFDGFDFIVLLYISALFWTLLLNLSIANSALVWRISSKIFHYLLTAVHHRSRTWNLTHLVTFLPLPYCNQIVSTRAPRYAIREYKTASSPIIDCLKSLAILSLHSESFCVHSDPFENRIPISRTAPLR